MSDNTSKVTYWNYLRTDELLSLQNPATNAHDEMQFIIVHQAFELWFKLAIYELKFVIENLELGNIVKATHFLNRVSIILTASNKGFDTLITMTQEGYLEFRDSLRPASGFQSSQFRIIELLAGIETSQEEEKFYWEKAVQAGETMTSFMEKYHTELKTLAKEYQHKNVNSLLKNIIFKSTNLEGKDGVKLVNSNTEKYNTLVSLFNSALGFEQAVMEFRIAHHKVTVFTVGNSAGTSSSHSDNFPSCASYLSGVIKDRSIIFDVLH
ncbi:MAG: hypothetical protein IPP08_10265 [Chlorobiota bacterium]|jgi:tryptophan 2,3-dioxygenase|nr:MAG: hypothetical protein IPP08_10265 [Chlorobiota bacterium]